METTIERTEIMSISNELQIMQGASKLLSMFGESEVLYITAEFAPFSTQQRPNLCFIPSNSKDKRIYFVEYKKISADRQTKN